MYVKVKDGAIERYPYSATDLIHENPGTSFPVGVLSDAVLDSWGVLPVVPSAPPAFDAATHKAVEAPPVLVEGDWVQQWTVEPLTTEELKSRVPQAVSKRQAMLALLGAGLLAQVNAAVAAMDGAAGDAARIEWEYATTIERASALVSGLSASLGISDAQLDALFIAAATL